MQCALARELMLEADLPELAGTADTELARHVSACADCRAVARRLIESHADLDRGLESLTPRKSAIPLRNHWWRWTPLPLAAAAVVALLIARSEESVTLPDPLLARLMFPAPPVVTPAPGKQAVIIEKNDLTVVWLY
jgi:hypothetical protein